VSQAGLDIGVAEVFQVVSELADAGERGEAAFGVIAVLLEVLADEGFEKLALVVGQRTPLAENFVEGAGFVGEPDADGGYKIVVRDKVVLEGEEAEEEVAIDVGGGHGEFPRTSCWRSPGGVHHADHACGAVPATRGAGAPKYCEAAAG